MSNLPEQPSHRPTAALIQSKIVYVLAVDMLGS